MADAFGLAVNIATVVDLFVKIGVQCSVYCANVKAAPRDIRDILNEADRFGATLKDIQRVLAGPNRTNIETLQNLCSGIGACHLLLDDLATKLEQGTRARLVWPFKRHEVDSILAKLKGHRTAISLDLQIHQKYVCTTPI